MRSNQWFVRIAVIAVLCLIVGGGFLLVGGILGGKGPLFSAGNNRFNLGPISIGTKRYDGPLENKKIELASFDTLDIELAMVELVVREGDDISLELIDVPVDTIIVQQDDSHLRIYNKHDFNWNYNLGNIKNKVVLIIPEKLLENVEISLSMGMLRISSMQTQKLAIKSSMTNIEMKGLFTQGLLIESSMADIEVSGILQGTTSVENSMGNVELYIEGNKDDYAYKLNNAMGAVTYDRISLEGLAGDTHGNSEGIYSLSVENSMGNVSVWFE